ncbi:aspartate kinase [Algoriphagus sp.]|uniref:aspartate kinase n=1 Tax=Algoriphagus sp. TaxID=1872435 RepID=UPI0025E6DDB8|nr:aspartate kinase [Algoriphagus sp.]
MTKTNVFKFGGASVKDADALKNLAKILRNRLRKNIVIVVSAMGKTTNLLETILNLKLEKNDFSLKYANLKSYHFGICQELFPENHRIFSVLENQFISLEKKLEVELSKENYDEVYDGIVSFGELISSKIVMEFLCLEGLVVLWQDAREIISTNYDYRFAKINWEKTRKNCQLHLKPKLEKFPVVTQGFIGADQFGKTTTLGREGSDFTAAIIGSCLNASSVTIWKDVPGVLNADPKRFSETVLFPELDYKQAAEMTYYGASVIHPKTIKPLANAGIPLYVKSFLSPDSIGTKIHAIETFNPISTFVIKENQVLVSFKVTDFTFIEEIHIHKVYEELRRLKLRVNMLQISAISISLVMDSQPFNFEKLLERLRSEFEIRYNEGLELLTIMHPEKESIVSQLEGFDIFLEQSTRNTVQIVRRRKA